MDDTGNEQWSATFGGDDYYYGSSVRQTSNGGYIVCGSSYLETTNGRAMYLLKLDDSGQELWSNDYNIGGYSEGSSALQTSDGGYIVVGSFLVKTVREGLLNDANSSGDAKVCVLLVGERPDLTRAKNMVIYLGYEHMVLDVSANRNAFLHLYDGGLDPLEPTVFTSQLLEKVRKHKQRIGA